MHRVYIRFVVYVCVCQAVREAEVRRAVAAGVDDVEQLGEQLGVGLSCGTCREVAQALIDERLETSPALAIATAQ